MVSQVFKRGAAGKKEKNLIQARKFYLFIFALLQIVMLVFLNLSFYAYDAGVFPTFKLSSLIFLTSVIIIISAGTTVLVANRLLQITNREARLEADLRFIRETQKLNLKIRSQRHDFYNHITSLYGFIRSKRFEEAKVYMESLYQDIKQVKYLLDLEPLALAALLSLKLEKAEKYGVDFSWQIELEKDTMPLATQEFTQILGNLLDNAIDAAKSAEQKIVKLVIEGNDLGLIINVANSTEPVFGETFEHIFEAGFTTKNDGEHSGLGLYIVKQIIERRHGEIDISETEDFPGLEIQVFVPQKSVP